MPRTLRIAFVIPWYGKSLGGGAETACRALAHAVTRHSDHLAIEILTTTLESFATHWNRRHFEERVYDDEGIAVRRFHPNHHYRRLYQIFIGRRLARPGTSHLWLGDGTTRSPLPRFLERYYMAKMVTSSGLNAYLTEQQQRYDYVLFTPYLYGTSYFGSKIVVPRALIMPCLHDERYAYISLYREMMSAARASLYLVPSEQELARRIYGLDPRRQFLLGAVVEKPSTEAVAERFRNKYGITEPYVVYSGRKIVGKNLPTLVEDFLALKATDKDLASLELVIIGKGDLDYTHLRERGIRDLGFVSEEDKGDCLAGALALCNPSVMESFSIVLMEAWLSGTPCLVNSTSECMRDHCAESGGGLLYHDRDTLQCGLRTLLNAPSTRAALAEKGRLYVRERYGEAAIATRFAEIIQRLQAEDQGISQGRLSAITPPALTLSGNASETIMRPSTPESSA